MLTCNRALLHSGVATSTEVYSKYLYRTDSDSVSVLSGVEQVMYSC